MIYIYTLSDPETKLVRYVGKTSCLKSRLRAHEKDESGNRKSTWVKSLKNRGLTPVIEVIEETDEENWQECERFWIESLRQMGCKLVNGDSGGSGCKKISLESRLKMSASQTGKKWPLLQRLKVSETRKGMRLSDSTKLKISIALTGKKCSESHIEKMRIDAIKINKTPRSQK